MEFLQEKDRVLNGKEALDETNPRYTQIKDSYAGAQYPNQAELEGANYLVSVLKQKFRCIDPLDEGIVKFKDRKFKISDVKDLLIQ